MKTLKEIINEAEEKKVAVGHFNISNIEGLWGIFNAAKNLNLPVIIGLSEGERDFVGIRQAVALVKSIREEFDYLIYINADHTHTLEGIEKAVRAGFDAVIIDGANLPLEENIELTKKAVELAKSINKDVLVEAELGYIGSSSKLLDEIPEGVSLDNLTTPEEAKEFVEKTNVDLLAPSVGNLHGMMKKAKNPELNIERISKIRKSADIPLVLHGGSGISDNNFKEVIKAGISTIHINTEIRLAYKNAMIRSLEENPNELAPYRIMKPVVEAVQRSVEKRLRLFNDL
ncbi:ketose-bisphosphate aldolase [Patescibacteria group bacterium]